MSEFRFALLIISICFFRYSFVAFAIPYIVLINFRGRNYVSSTFIARLQSLCRNFFCSFFSVVDAVKSTSFLSRSWAFGRVHVNELIRLTMIFGASVFLAVGFGLVFRGEKIFDLSLCESIKSILLLIGFREAFYLGSSCLQMFDPALFARQFIVQGVEFSLFNYYGSLVFGILNVLVTFVGFWDCFH